MQGLSFKIALLLFGTVILSAQSPHGPKLSIDCAKCHSSTSWSFDQKQAIFSHDSTDFSLKGQHKALDCRSCHESLKFEEAKTNCNSCHLDVHNQTVGLSCERCHTEASWIVDNITEIHDRTNFPLIGVHKSINCNLCHLSETNIRFNPIGINCIDCHRKDFDKTKNPDHQKNHFSTNCTDCHSLTEQDWVTDKVDHGFFPLEQGHDLKDCAKCHKSATYSDISRECIACHQADYQNTKNPDHQAAGFPKDCANCHTLAPDWKPAQYSAHDVFFPISSGKHKNTWIQCQDCHKNPTDFNSFTCVSCHKNPETDKEHEKVNGYVYNDQACLACHPSGSSEQTFDHNSTGFVLNGGHQGVDCLKCHDKGFKGTPSTCISCHQEDFNKTVNPDHKQLGLSNDCASCHTTTPGWMPARFDNHNNYYVLQDAHALIANDCKACHNGDYKNTPNTCLGCHQADFNNTKDPDHKAGQFPTDCASCHSQKAWQPSTFDHDGQHFPVFSGKHKGVWNQCLECHNNPSDYRQYSCTICHLNPETDKEHDGIGGYVYQNNACLACHPTGDADFKFDHNTTGFPLTGAHQQTNCLECHSKGFKNTPSECVACHQNDFDQSINPKHKDIGLSTDCISCHTTQPGWTPAKFDVHNNYYVLQDAHAIIANDCKVCHNGNYQNTPNTCVGCHQGDFNNAKDPDHLAGKFPTDCASCHNQKAWEPSTFNHDGMHFPIYSGKHKGVWNKCAECHLNPSDYRQFSCTVCHTNPETDEDHKGIGGYVYENNACLACHPTGDADVKFDHNTTGFSLTGAHLQANCLECHANGFKNTPGECVACHQTDFDQSLNPKHKDLGISTDCATCHTTQSGWNPARFDIHNNYYVLQDAHALIASDCKACHNGNYQNTPNTCVGCHLTDYNNTKDPNHMAAQFPNDCASCHNQKSWEPSTFDHDTRYFPVYSGKHKGVWNQCIECHTNPSNYQQFSCTVCHLNPETDEDHKMVGGYYYQNDACFACHPTGDADFKFDHNTTGFPLTGAHQVVNCQECHSKGFKGTSTVCVDCHQLDFDQSINPKHKDLGFPTDCASCHTTQAGWMPARFDLHSNYYVLDGAHAAIANDCNTCHKGDYNNTPNTCVGCHLEQFNSSLNPNHKDLMIPTDCASCHTTTPGWAPARFDIHNSYYPLNGAHAKIANDCVVCHNGNYNNTPNTCVGCHQEDYNNTKDPDHKVAQFPTDCATCHSENAWVPSTFNHDGLYFPIYSGTHKMLWDKCVDCHTNPTDYKQFTCIGCHINPETDEDHLGVGGYIYASFACLACHPTGEKKMAFDHNLSQFPLTGAHKVVDCKECHMNGYKGTPTECNQCHLSDYNNSSNPSHVNLNLSTDCASCHTTAPGWEPARFDIHDNFYVLDGAHASISNDCKACHHGNYNNTPSTCVGCHNTDYNNSLNPRHASLNIPKDCANCHTTAPGWAPATFDIHNNYFVLDGAHEPVAKDCFICHKGNYNNTPNTCVGCHLTDFNSSVNPNHVSLNIPKDCASCHTTAPDWEPATFGIHNNYYVLAGAHAIIANDCATCHHGDYNNTPNTCYGCHQIDYNNTNNPDHQAANFPTTCATCHSQSAWTPANFNHDGLYFPIYSGKHKDEWNQCSDCHTNSTNYKIFSCFSCHPKGEMDNEHNGVNGYSYNSAACYSCHPKGKK
ncbi:MAG: hypothetical protein IPG87_03365 [Saprospiraceae bacterium]|nr:hypothetical protein [Candidatus Vicinibacter affinis]